MIGIYIFMTMSNKSLKYFCKKTLIETKMISNKMHASWLIPLTKINILINCLHQQLITIIRL